MPRQIESVADLRLYVHEVLRRADEHANEVDEVGLALLGGIVWRADRIEVRTYDGEMVNVLWMTLANARYAFAYNHADRAVEVRGGTLQGQVVASFTNQSTNAEVKRFFESL